jgi:hypothetical protein
MTPPDEVQPEPVTSPMNRRHGRTKTGGGGPIARKAEAREKRARAMAVPLAADPVCERDRESRLAIRESRPRIPTRGPRSRSRSQTLAATHQREEIQRLLEITVELDAPALP